MVVGPLPGRRRKFKELCMSVMVFMCGNHDHLPCLKLYKFINQIIYKMSRTLNKQVVEPNSKGLYKVEEHIAHHDLILLCEVVQCLLE